MGEMSAEMLIEEVEIAIGTGRCPRCGQILMSSIGDDEWKLSCPGCRAVYGGSI